MKRFLFALATLLFLQACKTSPHVTCDLEFTKAGDDCSQAGAGIKMNSNLNGERYEFQRCLDADFSKDNMHCEQRGNVVEVRFDRRNSRQVLFNLVLDLDAYPRYDTLIIDGTPIGIKPYEP